MGVDDRGLPVAVMGPPDLLLTGVVDALRARGYDTMHLHRADPEVLPDGPGVVIVDLDRQDVGQVARAVSAGWTVVAVGAEDERDRAAAAVVAGAAEWIGKDTPFSDLVAAVAAGIAGELRMSDELRERWHERHRRAEQARATRGRRLLSLSRREAEVLRHLAEGHRAAEIAAILFVSLATVRTHIRSILTKLEVNSQEQAVAVYREADAERATAAGPNGLVSGDDFGRGR